MAASSPASVRFRAAPIHPFLIAAYPVLFLYSVNVGEVGLDEVWLPLAASIGAAAAVLGVARLVLGDAARAGLVTTLALATFFGYGHARSLAASLGLPGGPFVVAAGLAVVAALVVVHRARAISPRTTGALNLAGIVLVLAAVVPVLGEVVLAGTGTASTGTALPVATRRTDRDIYYIVPDRYGSRRVLETYYGLTSSLLYDRLDELGFHVVDDARANYPRTLPSLAAVLNLRYLDDEAARAGPEATDLEPLEALLQEHLVGRFLKSQGYTYVHLGAWWDATERNRLADVNPRPEGGSDFLAKLHDTTLLPPATRLLRRLGVVVGGPADEDERHYETARFQLAELERIRTLPGPKFVLVHLLLPHPPYVFNPDGSFMTEADREGRSRNEIIGRQVEFTDRALVGFIERILAVPPDERPIVLLQADEGPSPRRYSRDVRAFQWAEATVEELDHKFGILSAYHLPDFPGSLPHPGMTPVNSFRLILSGYFGLDLPLLPDRLFVPRDWRHPYDLTDVTDRLPPVP